MNKSFVITKVFKVDKFKITALLSKLQLTMDNEDNQNWLSRSRPKSKKITQMAAHLHVEHRPPPGATDHPFQNFPTKETFFSAWENYEKAR